MYSLFCGFVIRLFYIVKIRLCLSTYLSLHTKSDEGHRNLHDAMLILAVVWDLNGSRRLGVWKPLSDTNCLKAQSANSQTERS